jgi:hypothetical protein
VGGTKNTKLAGCIKSKKNMIKKYIGRGSTNDTCSESKLSEYVTEQSEAGDIYAEISRKNASKRRPQTFLHPTNQQLRKLHTH